MAEFALDMMLGFMEEDMLQEAMRRSSEGHAGHASETADPEIRVAEILSKLSRTQWKAERNSERECEIDECSLCLDHFKIGEDIVTLHCKHFFHENCLTPWLAKSTLCPICKQDVETDD